eukprot:1159475-Pelagomonas_calceolata.AAC.3
MGFVVYGGLRVRPGSPSTPSFMRQLVFPSPNKDMSTRLVLSQKLFKERKTTKAEEPLPTSIKDKEKHWFQERGEPVTAHLVSNKDEEELVLRSILS